MTLGRKTGGRISSIRSGSGLYIKLPNGKYKMSQTARCWDNMIDRVSDPKATSWDRYGGRGIIVCERWRTFANFLADMGEKPSGLTLERIDNNGNYEPLNCRWATPKEQGQNRNTNVFLEFSGRRLNIAQWAEVIGISRFILYERIRRGWSVEDALTTPRVVPKDKARFAYNGDLKRKKAA